MLPGAQIQYGKPGLQLWLMTNVQDMVLHVELYSREPIFLREKLRGTAAVALKEFMAKYNNNSASSSTEVGSYQLRKANSNKPQGFVDISIRVSERENPGSYPGFGSKVRRDEWCHVWGSRTQYMYMVLQVVREDLFSWTIELIFLSLLKVAIWQQVQHGLTINLS